MNLDCGNNSNNKNQASFCYKGCILFLEEHRLGLKILACTSKEIFLEVNGFVYSSYKKD